MAPATGTAMRAPTIPMAIPPAAMAKTIASGCPFCMTMLSNAVDDFEKGAEIEQLDLAEFLDRSIDYTRVAAE